MSSESAVSAISQNFFVEGETTTAFSAGEREEKE
jgi:hypothetical protein